MKHLLLAGVAALALTTGAQAQDANGNVYAFTSCLLFADGTKTRGCMTDYVVLPGRYQSDEGCKQYIIDFRDEVRGHKNLEDDENMDFICWVRSRTARGWTAKYVAYVKDRTW